MSDHLHTANDAWNAVATKSEEERLRERIRTLEAVAHRMVKMLKSNPEAFPYPELLALEATLSPEIPAVAK